MTAVLSVPATEPLVLDDVEVLQVAFELSGVKGKDLLPPALTPTNPTLLTVLVIRVPDGPLGPLTWASARLSCRAGARARTLVVGQQLAGHDEVLASLAARWGIGGPTTAVRLERRYDSVRATGDGLDVTMLDPAPISPHDVQYVTALMPVRTDARQDRLAQVELDVEATRCERGRPCLGTFDGSAWGDERLVPKHPVAATLAVGRLTLPAVRFLMRADVPPHEGTEVVRRA
jgi:hypothetical protein